MSSRIEDEAACAALTVAFAYYADRRMYREVADLFSQDGKFKRPGLEVQGRTDLFDTMALRPAGIEARHFCAAPMFLSVSEAAIEAVTYFTMYVAEAVETGLPVLGPPAVVGEYRDTFVRTGEGWRIGSRESVPAMIPKAAG